MQYKSQACWLCLERYRPEMFVQKAGSKVVFMWAKSLQSCLTLWDPMDCSSSGSSVHWFLQARILEWVVTSSSRGPSWPKDQTRVSGVSCIGRQVLNHQCHMGCYIVGKRKKSSIFPLKSKYQCSLAQSN